MSELAYKRRLRERKRRIATTLEAQGYRVRTFDNGPFHLFACRGRNARAIRIEFGNPYVGHDNTIRLEPLPDRCMREIWKISADGRVVVVVKVSSQK